jgi:S-formylglutathione hydrolase FrmB
MSYYIAEATTGLIVSGQSEIVFTPGDQRPDGNCSVILLHGATAGYDNFGAASRWASAKIPAYLAMAGIPCISIEAYGDAFANNDAMSAITPAITYMNGRFSTHPTKACILGISMGGGTGIRYAGLNPSKVSALIGIIPMVDIDHLYQNNILGLRAAVGTAWGVTYPTALPADANLDTYGAIIDANNIPTKFWYDDVDTAILAADVVSMAALTGGTAVEIDPSDLGHTEGSINAAQTMGAGAAKEMVDFFLANGA